jgi:hypothetical protein
MPISIDVSTTIDNQTDNTNLVNKQVSKQLNATYCHDI